MKKIIHFIRHGKTAYNQEKRIQGSVDIPLSNIGLDQANNFNSKNFLSENYDVGFYSSLNRSKKTLDIIINKLDYNLPIEVSNLIVERSYGIFEGLKENEILEKYPELFLKWKSNENTTIDNGETIENVVSRVLDFIKMISLSNYKNILVVTHSGVLYALYKYINKIPLGDRPSEIYFENCCSVYLEIDIEDNMITKLDFKHNDKRYTIDLKEDQNVLPIL